MSVLVVAAHPDDEVLGCGGTIIRHVACGDTVNIVFLTDGEKSRLGATEDDITLRQQAAKSAAIALGAQAPIFLGFTDNRLDSPPLLAVVQALEAAVLDFSPETVYTHHSGDLNIDHRVAAAATLTAFRPQPACTVKRIYGFEVLSSTHWAGPGGSFDPVRFVDITSHLATKRRALEFYQREMRPPPHARSFENVEHLATFRGMTHGLTAAEAFTVLREIVA